MDTDQTTEQLNQCLAALASANQHWWEYFAITQTQADELSYLIVKLLLGAISFAIFSQMMKKS